MDGDHGSAPPGPTTSGLDLARLAAAEADLAAVERAMGRLDAGTWGTCETCATPLDPAALAQRPTGSACPEHA